MTNKIQIPENITQIPYWQATENSPVLKKAFGRCQFPYEIGDIMKRLSAADRSEVIATAIAERNVRILWSLDFAVSRYGNLAEITAFMDVIGDSSYLPYNLVRRSEPEIRAFAAKVVTDTQQLLRLAADESEMVRKAVAKNPNTPVEAHSRLAPPLGYITVSQGHSAERVRDEAIANATLNPKLGKAPWGTGIFRVNADKTMNLMSSDYDTSG